MRRRWTRWRSMRRTAVSGRMGLLVWTNLFLSGVSNFDHYSWGTLLWLFKCSLPIATQSAHVREMFWFWWKSLIVGHTYFSNVIPISRASFGMISGSRFGSTHFVVEPTTLGVLSFFVAHMIVLITCWNSVTCVAKRQLSAIVDLLVLKSSISMKFVSVFQRFLFLMNVFESRIALFQQCSTNHLGILVLTGL